MPAVCEGRKHNNSNSRFFKSWLVFYVTFWDQASLLHPLFCFGEEVCLIEDKETSRKKASCLPYFKATLELLKLYKSHEHLTSQYGSAWRSLRNSDWEANLIPCQSNQYKQESWQNCFTFLSCDIQNSTSSERNHSSNKNPQRNQSPLGDFCGDGANWNSAQQISGSSDVRGRLTTRSTLPTMAAAFQGRMLVGKWYI